MWTNAESQQMILLHTYSRLYPGEFRPVSQFGHIIPAYKLDGAFIELEIFDQQNWPQRPQYNIQNASRRSLNINGYIVKTFSPEWILREKILSQHQRQGNKADVDIRDAIQILFITTPGKPELDFDSDLSLAEALLTLIRKRPDQERSFEAENTMQCRFWELDDSTCTVVGPYILRVVI
ncbi:hypothetical protein TMatcc_005467 [Talaromyces marneffei ATCC 18224]